MPATRSRTSTEAPEVAVEDKKTEESSQPEKEPEVTETAVNDEKTDNSAETKTDSTSDEKPVDTENGSSDALKSDTNGDQTADNSAAQVENGSAKRKSTGDESGDAPDSTDITPKKAKVDVVDESIGADNNGSGEKADPKSDSAAIGLLTA